MKRGDAYALLADRLNRLWSDGYDALRQRAEQPASSEAVRLNGESILIDIEVVWADRGTGTVRVTATAYGPSTWMTQRLDESFLIAPGQTTPP